MQNRESSVDLAKTKRDTSLRELVHKFDWGNTSLGKRASWSEVLRTSVELCLHSGFPTLLLWGEKFVQIYNDAYRNLIGQRHPGDLGTRAQDKWQKSNWIEAKPLLESVMKEGKTILLEDHKFVSVRNGYPEERFYTISYSPVIGVNGMALGVFITVFDKTEEILHKRIVEGFRDHPLEEMFFQSPLSVTVLKGPQFIVATANKRSLENWGKSSNEVLNKPALELIPEATRPAYEKILTRAFNMGERVILKESPIVLEKNGVEQTLFMKLVCEPIRENDGSVSGVVVLADDITEQVNTRITLEENESRLKLALEAAEIGTYEWNIQEDKFRYSNRMARIFGFSDTEELKQIDFSNLIHPDDRAKRAEAHERAMITGTLFYELRIVRPDNATRWIRANGLILKDTQERPWKMYGTAIDITEQKARAEVLEDQVRDRTAKLLRQFEQLKRSEERYYKMIDEVQDYAIILLDIHGNIQNWNLGAQKIKGYREEEIIGKHFSIFYGAEDRERNLPGQLLHEAATKGRAIHEGYRVRKDGTRFWGSITITALHGKDDEIIGFSKVTRDLTEKKAAEDQLNAYTAELEARNRELEQFTYVASHDLQEPLRKIQTFTEIIQKNIHAEELALRYLDKIDNSARRMSELMKAVLSYTRISKEQASEEVDLNSVLEGVENDLELLVQEKNAQIRYHPLPLIRGNKLQIGQLFYNLVGNALKFSVKNPEIEVLVRAITDNEILMRPENFPPGKYHEIIVADNGIGFEQKYAEQVFDIFQRLHVKQKFSGTGIGLAICKRIVENHKGHITVLSEPDRGSKFFVYLPA